MSPAYRTAAAQQSKRAATITREENGAMTPKRLTELVACAG
jgi:hypothetical protein